MSSREAVSASLFVAELVAARTAAGLSQEALGALINYSGSLVGMIESGRRAPSLDVAQRIDQALKTPGTFVRLQQHARTTPLPAWFQPYASIEATASQLRSWQPLVIDGLLQTEDYARALLTMRPSTSAEELDELVAARMERQAVLARDAAMAERPSVTIEIVPLSAGAHSGLTAPFAIAEADDAGRVGYLDTASEGLVIESRPAVNDLMFTFDTLRSEALTRRASRDLIMKWAGGYDQPD